MFYLDFTAITCATPPSLTSATLASCTSNEDFNSICTYTCAIGFITSDGSTSPTTTCGGTGQWSPDVIDCSVGKYFNRNIACR